MNCENVKIKTFIQNKQISNCPKEKVFEENTS